MRRAIDFENVTRAMAAVRGELPATPAWEYPLLSERLGCAVVVKHENAQPTGAFKVRGGLTLLAMTEQLPRGLVTASTGNHAQSVAFAARRAGLPARVIMPEGAAPNKVAAIEALGAEVEIHGAAMGAAMSRATEVGADRGWRVVRPDDPEIILGHATVHLEFLTAHPDLETLYVPLGSGTSAAGACLVRNAIAPQCRIVAVQSRQAPAGYESWKAGEVRSAACATRAGGLATDVGFETTQQILRKSLDDFLLVDDDDLDQAIVLYAKFAHTLAEGAGAAGLAGALHDPERPERVGVILSGGNADDRELSLLAEPAQRA